MIFPMRNDSMLPNKSTSSTESGLTSEELISVYLPILAVILKKAKANKSIIIILLVVIVIIDVTTLYKTVTEDE